MVNEVLKRYGTTFAEELNIRLDRQTPSEWFKLLVAALLFSTRIGHRLALRALEALFKKGWTHPRTMAAVPWEERTRTLNQSGYARYDGRASTMLEQTSRLLLEKYDGDLRNLRESAHRDPDPERTLLKEFKGIGDVGVDIFFREAQGFWDELYPFADKRALEAAGNLRLPKKPQELAKLVPQKAFPRFIAALVRIALSKDPALFRELTAN